MEVAYVDGHGLTGGTVAGARKLDVRQVVALEETQGGRMCMGVWTWGIPESAWWKI